MMTTEMVLLLAIYAFVILGIFQGDGGPRATFKVSAPRLAAHIERDISVGHEFRTKDGETFPKWEIR